jgi:hypothetical protein
MTNTEQPPAITEDLMAELEEACADAMSGIRRPEKMAEAERELEEGREEIRERLGVLDLANELTDRDE